MEFENIKTAMTNNLVHKTKVKIVNGFKEQSSIAQPGTIFTTVLSFDKKEQTLFREYGYIIFALDLLKDGIYAKIEDDIDGGTITCYRRVD